MGKRVRQVYPTREIAHLWASQNLSYARNPQGNIYFEGKSIFSYGSHFEMARFITDAVVFMTNRGYSVTTSGHLSMVRDAVSHKTVFEVPTFEDHNKNVEYFLASIASTVASFQRMRSGMKYHYAELLRTRNRLLMYASMFKKDITPANRDAVGKLRRTEFIAKKVRGTWEAKQKRHNEMVEHAAKTRRANRDKRHALNNAIWEAERVWGEEISALNLEAWQKGAPIQLRGYDLPVRLRVVGTNIETTRGAVVPVDGAKILWDMLQAKLPVKGFKIGHYAVSGVHAGKLIIGCHEIPIKEVYRMAKVLGLESGVLA